MGARAHLPNVDSGQWTRLPDMGQKRQGEACVGGNRPHTTGPIDEIYQFDEVNHSWIVRPEKLRKGRHFHSAVLVPEKFNSNLCS